MMIDHCMECGTLFSDKPHIGVLIHGSNQRQLLGSWFQTLLYYACSVGMDNQSIWISGCIQTIFLDKS